jgi:phenylpyruvate tautomerase PptA (4-oxalocrotonate tautomerase family)
MPIYQCYSPKGLLSESARAKLAEEMTSMYCNITGAPESWVKVLFQETPQGECFAGGKAAAQSLILALNRHGRDLETRRAMLVSSRRCGHVSRASRKLSFGSR